MGTVNISLLEMVDITKANGEITKWKEKVSPSLNKANFNIQVNGKPISTMVGEFYIQIHNQIQNGFLMKDSLKMELNKVEDK